MVYAAEMVAVFACYYGELVRGMPRVWVDLGGQIIISLGGAPIAFLVLLNELGFAVTGEVAKLDKRLVAREEDLRLQGCGNALAQGRLGGCFMVRLGVAGGAREPTVILPFPCNLAQLGNTVELGIQVQYVLAVEALAGLDELEIGLLELSNLHDAVLGALELSLCQRRAPAVVLGGAYKLVLLSECGVDPQVRVPERRLESVGRGVCEVGEEEGFAGGTVPVGD